jgi:hypothetical protein
MKVGIISQRFTAGVPISIVSKWAGHYGSAFTQKTYVHASYDDCAGAVPRWPGFTRSLRNCEKL